MIFPKVKKSGDWYEIEGKYHIVITTSPLNAIYNWVKIFIQNLTK